LPKGLQTYELLSSIYIAQDRAPALLAVPQEQRCTIAQVGNGAMNICGFAFWEIPFTDKLFWINV
jgi:hypothetical protein